MPVSSISISSTSGGAAIGDIESIDLSAVTAWFIASGCWPDHVANEVEIEYRRYLLLKRFYDMGGVLPSGLVLQFHLRHSAVAGAPDNNSAGYRFPGEIISPGDSADPRFVRLYEQILARPMPPYWNMFDISEASLDSSSPTLE